MERRALPLSLTAPAHRGVRLVDGGADVCIFSRHADSIWFCLFDDVGEREISRWRLCGRADDLHYGFVPAIRVGGRYGLRADGPWQPERGHRFDPAKLLVDPHATRIDRPFRHGFEICLPRDRAVDTAPYAPRAIVEANVAQICSPRASAKPRFIYEVAVKAFTKLHPDVPLEQRDTLAGLTHPKTIEHLVRLGVSHVELMPVAAWIDERHLPALGLRNAWGYNPVCFMALDPRLASNGISDLRSATDALHEANISVILDVVFNHTGESDTHGATLSLRGLDNAIYYRADEHDASLLINDTGCGNTLACDREPVIRLVMDTLHHFVRHADIDGFRFDLAPVLGRTPAGFDPAAPLLQAIECDPELSGKILIAEPWDVGPGGYRVGEFSARWREWNGSYRDDVRRFWRGDAAAAGPFATRIVGSSDIFQSSGRSPSASVNFIAAHDGFTLRDLVSHEQRHNETNGENNADGHADNAAWNCGIEGETKDARVNSLRDRDIRALLATLFLSRGTPMLTAGDELGRTQGGNNNAYAQDNETTWLDWCHADTELVNYVALLTALRRQLAPFLQDKFLSGQRPGDHQSPDAQWLHADGRPLASDDWREADYVALVVSIEMDEAARRCMIAFNRLALPVTANLPGGAWRKLFCSAESGEPASTGAANFQVPARSVSLFIGDV